MHNPLGYSDRRWTFFTSGDQINDLVVKGGRIWAATDGGVVSWDLHGDEYRAYTVSDGLPDNSTQTIVLDEKGNLWAGTAFGVARFSGQAWQNIGGPYNVIQVVLDRNGNLWTNSVPDGLDSYDGKSWRHFTDTDVLPKSTVKPLVADHAGNIWIATGASQYDGNAWKTFTTNDGLAGNMVYAIFADNHGDLWFGTDKGVSRYDGKGWVSFTTKDGLADNYVSSILEGKDGVLWFGTSQSVSSYDGKTWRTIKNKEVLTTN